LYISNITELGSIVPVDPSEKYFEARWLPTYHFDFKMSGESSGWHPIASISGLKTWNHKAVPEKRLHTPTVTRKTSINGLAIQFLQPVVIIWKK
jgi:hypothetical protein